MEAEIPQRHWHLNDPGVVPNLLQTGAGSPTGICVYEGTLLPKVFHDQVIHCDAGPERRAGPIPRRRTARATRPRSVNILDGHAGQLVPARATCASLPTARCSSPTGTIRASAATTSRTSTRAASSASPRPARSTRCRSTTSARSTALLAALKSPTLERAVPGVRGARR